MRHMIVETIFWFHPMVWWIRTRLVEERERACDEAVLRASADPETYAEGILNVCKWYLGSPLACAPGVTGADFKKRIEAIVAHRGARTLNAGRRALVIGAAFGAVAGPFALGMMGVRPGRGQGKADAPIPAFEAASVKPSAMDANASDTVFETLPQQLGLKLEGQKAAVEMLVIDRADKLPTAN